MAIRRIKTKEEEEKKSSTSSQQYGPTQSVQYGPEKPKQSIAKTVSGFVKGAAKTAVSAVKGISSLLPGTGPLSIPIQDKEKKSETRKQTINFIERIGASALSSIADTLDFAGDFIANNPKVLSAILSPTKTPSPVSSLLKNHWEDFYKELDKKGYTPTEKAKQATQQLAKF